MISSILRIASTLVLLGPAVINSALAGSDPIDVFHRYCYEPNRLGGRSQPPATDDGWQPVPAELRQRLNLSAADGARAWLWSADRQGELMILEIHERRLEKMGVHSGQMRLSCRVISASSEATSPDTHAAALQAKLEALLGDPPGATGGQVLERLGYPTPEGWNQACWTILTPIENRDWAPYRHDRQPRCVWLSSPANYAVSQYIVVRLLTRSGSPIAIVAMDRTLPPRALTDHDGMSGDEHQATSIRQ